MKMAGWVLAFCFGTGWFFSWMSEWDESDKKANLVLEIIYDAHKVRFSDEDLDRFLTFRRVIQKDKLIKDFIEKEHPFEPLSLFSDTEKSIYDSNAWRSAISAYLKSEERIHPESYKKITMKAEWSEFKKNNYYAKYLQQSENKISESVLASLSSNKVFNVNSKKAISGIVTAKKPKNLIIVGYPVVELSVTSAVTEKSGASKAMVADDDLTIKAREEIRKKLDHIGIEIKKGQSAFFIPNYQEIPNSYFGVVAKGEKLNAIEEKENKK